MKKSNFGLMLKGNYRFKDIINYTIMKTKLFILLSLITSMSFAQVNEQDSLALVALYNSTNGPGWDSPNGWLSESVEYWFGVTIENGRVVEIRLGDPLGGGFGLTGYIPAQIGDLTHLRVLNMQDNNITGNIPSEIGSLESLEELYLLNNDFEGNIPIEICNLDNLGHLYLQNNNLIGSIPAQIGDMSSLRVLCLSNNQLSGSIPEGIGNAVNLDQLFLQNNQLSGGIPESLGEVPSLKLIYLDNNQFSGTFPENILKPLLREITLNDNYFISVPNLSSYSLLSIYKIENNQLEFDCIESNMSLDTIDEFTYSPQDSVNIAIDTTVSKNSTIQFNTSVGGTANQYQWYHNQIPISGAIDSVLIMNSVQAEDEGLYTCVITNSLVPDLALWRRNIHLQVDTSNAINENGINTISVYIKNKQLIIDNINADCRLSIYTVQGNHLANYQLKRGEIFRKSLSNDPKSALLLVFYDKKRTLTRKIINR